MAHYIAAARVKLYCPKDGYHHYEFTLVRYIWLSAFIFATVPPLALYFLPSSAESPAKS